jgi:hypothetical protein
VIGYATQPGNVAADGAGKNSPYTTALAQAIRTPSQSLFDTFNAVGVAVKQATGGRQQPWLATSPIEGTFHFVAGKAETTTASPAAPAADPAANERAFWDSVKDSGKPAEMRAYLERYPDGLFAALASTRLGDLERASAQTAQGAAGTAPVAASAPVPAGSGGLLAMFGTDAKSSPSPGAVPSKGKVYLLRERSYMYAFRKPDVAIDGRIAGELANGGSLELELEAGTYTLTLSLQDYPAASTIELNVTAGGTHFLAISPKAGAYDLMTGTPTPSPGYSGNRAITNAGPYSISVLDEAAGRKSLARLTGAAAK